MHLRILAITGTAAALLTTLSAAAPALAAGPAAARTKPLAVLHVGQIDRQDVPSSGGCEPDTLVEPDVAISPFNSKIQVAVAHDCRFANGGAVDISYAWTHNGGATWHHAPVPGLTSAVGGKYPRASDPVVAFGADGSVYISALEVNVNNCDSGVAVSRSTDGGATFGKPVYVQQSTSCGVSDDKNWLVTDTQPNSPFYGRLYQFWTEFLTNGASPQVVRWSDDQGKHWSSTHFVTPKKQFSQDSQAFVEPDGTLVDLYLNAGHAIGDDIQRGGILRRATQGSGVSLAAQTSVDGGATWSRLSKVAGNIGGGPAGIRCCLPLATGDPATGRMFAVWNANGPGVQDAVELSTSTDGRNWSHPVQVTPGHSPKIQYINAAVAASGGRVFVSYGQRNLATGHGNVIQQEVTSAPEIGGAFAPPIALGPPSNLKYAAVAGGKFPGDYTGLSATPDRVTAAWCVSSQPAKPTAAYHQTLYAAVLKP
jgi:hypothetical protein